jgi:hypothetical protein
MIFSIDDIIEINSADRGFMSRSREKIRRENFLFFVFRRRSPNANPKHLAFSIL